MGRHSAGIAADSAPARFAAAPLRPEAPQPPAVRVTGGPVTDPRLFDAPRPVAPQLPVAPVAAAPRPSAPRLSAPNHLVQTRRLSAPLVSGPRMLAPQAQPYPQSHPQSHPQHAVREADAFTKRRGVALAACALAVLGTASGVAAMVPGKDAGANAAGFGRGITAATPVATTAASTTGASSSGASGTAACAAPQRIRHHGPRRTHAHAGHVRPLPAASSTPTSTPTASASPTATATPVPSTTPTPIATGTPAPSGSSGGTSVTSIVGALVANASNLLAGIYTLHDFGTQNSGAVVNGTLKGQGADRTVVEMTAGTSTKASQVPGDGNNQGGLANPTNPFYLLRGVNDLEDVTVRGTEQGHLYNGVYMTGANLAVKHVVVEDIPGDSNANPGETFAIGANRASGTNTVDDLTINGGSGALSSAGGLGINNSDATWNIQDLTANDLKYSAGIALWQVRGTFNIHNYVQHGGARSLGAERTAATVNLFDPVWDAGTTGHDVTYTWDGGYSGGSINFYYSSASTVPNRKIVIITNHASGIAASVHVYIAGVQQTTSDYVTVR